MKDAVDNQPSLLQTALARARGLNRRHLTLFVAAGLVADVAIAGAGLWWLGIFGSDPAEAARGAMQACLAGKAAEVATFDACLESLHLATDRLEDRRQPENADIAVRATTALQTACRTTLDRATIMRCAELPVIEGVVPEISVRTRVEALLRLADNQRLVVEGERLIRFGDGFGFAARGTALHATDRYARAAADYREAIKHFPDDPTLQENMARAEVSVPPL